MLSPENYNERSQSGAAAGRVYLLLREDILSGVVRPGEKVPIEQLVARYETSHIPIREALSGLAAEGLVQREERRGFFVTAVNVETLEELFKTRGWLEERALAESISNRTAQWDEAVVLASYWLSRTPKHLPNGAPNPDWRVRHRDFHHALISGCGSPTLLRYCHEMRDRIESYRYMAEGAAAAPKTDRTDEHRLIAEAVLAGDTELATTLLLEHYTKTLDAIRLHYARQNSAGPGLAPK